MAGMRIYTVHQRVWSSSPDRDAVLVREGFSWPAFFFSVAWALFRGFDIEAIRGDRSGQSVAREETVRPPVRASWGRVVVEHPPLLALAALADVLALSGFAGEAIGLAVAFWIGCEANDWRRAALRRRGYAELGVVCANDRARAEHRAFELRAGAGS